MFLRPLAAALLLVIADWGLWTWAIGAERGTVSLFAGLLMAPLFVALLWLATMSASAVIRAAAERLRPPPRPVAPALPAVSPHAASEQDQRLAA